MQAKRMIGWAAVRFAIGTASLASSATPTPPTGDGDYDLTVVLARQADVFKP